MNGGFKYLYEPLTLIVLVVMRCLSVVVHRDVKPGTFKLRLSRQTSNIEDYQEKICSYLDLELIFAL